MTRHRAQTITAAAHAGQLTDLSTILMLDHLTRHWGQPHDTEGGACFCQPRQADGMVVHRRMPWDPPHQEPPHA